MLVALISDVHANAVALRAVLEDIEARGVHCIVCAGDVVGYYPYPNETVALFTKKGISSVQGNHDRAVLNQQNEGMNRMATSAVMWTAARLNARSRTFLTSLPVHLHLRIDGMVVGVYHGSPLDPDQYVFEIEADEDMLTDGECDLLVLGHTHVPFIKALPHGIIVNPGSVGQPRDGDPRACYTIFDTARRKGTSIRLPYDLQAVADRTIEEGLPPRLASRLAEGR
jgi:putative phosphoesterase